MKLEKLFEITPSISSQLESEPRESSVEIHTLNHHMEMNQGKKEDRCRRIKWWGSKEGGGKLQFPDIGRQLLDGTQPLFPGPWITHFCLCYQSFLSTSDLGKSSNQWNKWCPEESTFSFIKNFFIGVQLLYNVLSISGVQQSGSAICIHISLLFWISFPFRSSQSTE